MIHAGALFFLHFKNKFSIMIPLTFKSRLEESLLSLCFATCEIALPTFSGKILAIFRLVYFLFVFVCLVFLLFVCLLIA